VDLLGVAVSARWRSRRPSPMLAESGPRAQRTAPRNALRRRCPYERLLSEKMIERPLAIPRHLRATVIAMSDFIGIADIYLANSTVSW
jgi:hypothetical protein